MSVKTDFLAKTARYYKASCEYNTVSEDGWVDRTYVFAQSEDRDTFMRDFNNSGLFQVFDVKFSESYPNRLYVSFKD